LEYKSPIFIEPTIHGDQRGYFFESYNEQTFIARWGISAKFVQDNESLSRRGTLRGLHYQLNPMAQAKLVRVVTGAVLDIAIDIRRSSEHFGRVYQYLLNDENRSMLFVPRGFAHGFVVLSESAIFQYKVDNFYSKEHERGIRYDDPKFAIDWQVPKSDILVSEKDSILTLFESAEVYP
jgi:dTDP-4-dehydrorhamnose 3,5-epimerase